MLIYKNLILIQKKDEKNINPKFVVATPKSSLELLKFDTWGFHTKTLSIWAKTPIRPHIHNRNKEQALERKIKSGSYKKFRPKEIKKREEFKIKENFTCWPEIASSPKVGHQFFFSWYVTCSDCLCVYYICWICLCNLNGI